MPRQWKTAAIAMAFAGLGESVIAQESDPRARRGLEVITELSGGQGQPVLTELQRDFPALGDAVLKYSLGEIVGRTVLDARTRQLATVAALAAEGHLPQLKIHAGYALNVGVKPEELVEVVYLTTVYSGFPRAINAALALREVFAARSIALPVEPPK
jgi:4-carboxymuconolactone decarboxylase